MRVARGVSSMRIVPLFKSRSAIVQPEIKVELPQKFCVKCKWAVDLHPTCKSLMYCVNPNNLEQSLVTAQMSFRQYGKFCTTQRGNTDQKTMCGKQGRWFEQGEPSWFLDGNIGET